MYPHPLKRKTRILIVVFAYNEKGKIDYVVRKLFSAKPIFDDLSLKYNFEYEIALMDDGSTDGSIDGIVANYSVTLLSHTSNLGAGASVKTVNKYALENDFDLIVHVAGNNKDAPEEIPKLILPILCDGIDYVQGSRYIAGGNSDNMPLYRTISTKYIHPLLFSMVAGRRITDSTNGFRAYRTEILKDEQIKWQQNWLDKYELEVYFFHNVIKRGYKVKEVPVTKIYPSKNLGYTKMKPITDWWSILKPLIYLGLGLKK